jgi:hypothetical protein
VRTSEHVKITTANYLPDHLLVDPAYADLGFIVAVAAASEAHTFVSGQTSSNSSYPIILGSNFQFDFRDHPILGTIGAFSQYCRGLPGPKPAIGLSRWAIDHARGHLIINRNTIEA